MVLSERNLRVLLAKLTQGDSACTIFTQEPNGGWIYVSAEPDDQHYADRTPGEMHPTTEALLKVHD